MKKIYLLILFFVLSISQTYASINPSINLVGTTPSNSTGVGYGGLLVFPSTNGVYINASALDTNPNANISISGNFWLQNLTSTQDLSLGWATFDFGSVSGAPHVVLTNNGNNTFTFNGYAWDKASGWIYFGETGVSLGKVIYNRNTGVINGCGFSQNIGWVCIDNYSLDTTPPNLNSAGWQNILKTSATDDSKNITTPEPISQFSVENWNSTAKSIYTSSSFSHDFRKAKDYSLTVVDTSGNSTDGNVKIVAGVPTGILSANNIGAGATASTFSSTLSSIKIANNSDEHNINFSLRDTYGNPIVNETGIKDVKVTLGFENNVDKDQINNFDFGDAISYLNNPFLLISGLVNEGIGYKSNGDYSIDVKSLAPTKSGYSYTTTNNDIKINKLIVKVTGLSGNTGVGEQNNTMIFYSNYANKYLKFEPSVYLSSITNDLSWKLLRDVKTTFEGILGLKSPINVTNISLKHILDTYSGSINQNNFISFQNIVGTNGVDKCSGNLKPNSNNTVGIYSYTLSECNLEIPDNSSNIIKSYNGTYLSTSTIIDKFEATPKVVLAGIPDFGVKYRSEISYNYNGNSISYPSYTSNVDNTLKNNQIKVSGIANSSDKNFSVIQEESIKYIGNISKLDVYTSIKKNIVQYQKIGKGVGSVLYTTGTYTLNNWPNGVDTIITDGADVIIGTDITKDNGKIKSIISLKGNTSNKGNIWIKSNVKNISAILVTDRSILSGDGINFYNENVAKNQLFIKGSILSYNTIGASSLSTPKCPFYITTNCDTQESKKYDFNNFRYYYNGIGNQYKASYGAKPGYDDAPMIVEYDSDIQLNIPKIFIIN